MISEMEGWICFELPIDTVLLIKFANKPDANYVITLIRKITEITLKVLWILYVCKVVGSGTVQCCREHLRKLPDILLAVMNETTLESCPLRSVWLTEYPPPPVVLISIVSALSSELHLAVFKHQF